MSGCVVTIAYIKEPTAGAYGTDFISSPSEPDVGLSQRVNGERGRSILGRLHVEAFQDTSDVVGLRQEKLSFFAMLTNLHSKYVSCRTEVLHGKLQPQFPNEFGELYGMLTGEYHVVHVDDEEDRRTVLSCFGEETVVLIAL